MALALPPGGAGVFVVFWAVRFCARVQLFSLYLLSLMCKKGFVRLGNSRVILRILGRRKMSAIFNCPNKAVLGVFSRLCGCNSAFGRILASRRRNTSRTTSNCTHTANGINIYFTASNPNSAGLMANVTATCVSSIPVITIAYGINASVVNHSSFRRISVGNVAVPVAGRGCVMEGIRRLTSILHGTFEVTADNEGNPILISVPGSVATTGYRCCPTPGRRPSRYIRPGAGSLRETIRLLGGTGGPLVCLNNNTVSTSYDTRVVGFTRGASYPIISSLVNLNTFPRGRELCINLINVRNEFRSGGTTSRYSILVAYKTEFSSHITNGEAGFTPGTRILRVSVSPTRVSGGIISRCRVRNSLGRILPLLAGTISRIGRSR